MQHYNGPYQSQLSHCNTGSVLVQSLSHLIPPKCFDNDRINSDASDLCLRTGHEVRGKTIGVQMATMSENRYGADNNNGMSFGGGRGGRGGGGRFGGGGGGGRFGGGGGRGDPGGDDWMCPSPGWDTRSSMSGFAAWDSHGQGRVRNVKFGMDDVFSLVETQGLSLCPFARGGTGALGRCVV